jgi:nucleotide-binding universal stress UspA family protein
MFSTVLVPLDGSTHAETVLPWVERLAPPLGAKVIVLRVVNLEQLPPSSSQIRVSTTLYEQWLALQTAEAEEYLAGIAPRLEAAGCQTTTQVAFGNTAGAIADVVDKAPDSTLVAMTTHGRTGLARVALGSVANEVVRAVEAPVLLVRPLAEQPQALDSILAPLDGSKIGEAVLPAVEAIARALPARVLLMLATDRHDAMAAPYLEHVADRLKQSGIGEVSHRVLAGPPGEAILQAATEDRSSLIAMTTYGRSGVRRWVFGSVAEQVLHAATVPTLLVRGREAESE